MSSKLTKKDGREAQRKTASREVIIEAAGAILARNPGASLSEIALAAGVGRATLHRWFAGKDDLVRALAIEALEEADRAFAEISAQKLTPIETLEAGFAALIPMGNKFHFLSNTDELMEDEEIVSRYIDELTLVADVVRALVAEGKAAADIPISWAVAHADGLIYTAWREVRDGRLTAEQATELATRSFLKGIS